MNGNPLSFEYKALQGFQTMLAHYDRPLGVYGPGVKYNARKIM
jgi:hypothetical protein